MRHSLIAAAAATLCLALAPADAQASESPQTRNLQDMLLWMQASNSIVEQAATALNSQPMQDILQILSAEPLDEAALGEATQKLDARCETDFARARALYGELDAPRRWDIGGFRINSMERKVFRTAQLHYDTLPDSLQRMEGVCDVVVEMTSAMASGDAEGVDLNRMARELNVVARTVMQNENRVMSGMAGALGDDGPNHWFHLIMIDTNETVMRELDITDAYLSMGETDGYMAERQRLGRVMLDATEERGQMIRRGRATIASTVAKLKSSPRAGQSAEMLRMLDSAVEATSTFTATFDVEDAILDNQRSSARLYMSGQSEAEVDAGIAQNDIAFGELVLQRMALAQSRSRAITGR